MTTRCNVNCFRAPFSSHHTNITGRAATETVKYQRRAGFSIIHGASHGLNEEKDAICSRNEDVGLGSSYFGLYSN